MTWSLALVAGDLSLSGPGGFATIADSQKIIQDLRCWLLEPRGTDPSHPDYGSTLDGGALPDGTYADSIIGSVVSDENMMLLEAEIRRVVLAYQQQQQDRLGQEVILYAGKNTFGVNEVVVSIEDITLTQVNTTAICTVTLQTSSGDSITITQPLT